MSATSARETSLDSIQRELTAFARRARATSARMHPELSLVSYTILAHLEEQQGCRATDLAAHYLLDKSTVSRQVAALERLGFIERRTDPADQRVQVLHLAPHGTAVLAAAQVSRRKAFDERLADWDPEDLTRFAAYLRRYNAAAATHPWPEAEPGAQPEPRSEPRPEPESQPDPEPEPHPHPAAQSAADAGADGTAG